MNEPGLRDLLTKLVIEVLSYVDESELNNVKERPREGIKFVKVCGIYKGRPIKYHRDEKGAEKRVYAEVVNSLDKGEEIERRTSQILEKLLIFGKL